MGVFIKNIQIQTQGKGTFEFTDQARNGLVESGMKNGLVSIFVKHTSCSLVMMENADPSARQDLENFIDNLVPENLPYFIHTFEGADDMPSHIKMALTRTSEQIPFSMGKLALGTWQGLFLWEHRKSVHRRQVVMTYLGE